MFLAGAGALFLLRDQQQETARERYGRHAEPLNEQVAARLALGTTLSNVGAFLSERAPEIDVRLLLLDNDLLVVYDSEATLHSRASTSSRSRTPISR